MISFKELQDGNLINTPFGYKAVGGVSADGVIYVDQGEDLSADEVDPIELTSEILLKTGFRFISDQQSQPIGVYEKSLIRIRYTGEKFFIEDKDNAEIQFVHELQNLYLMDSSERLSISEGQLTA